MGAQIVEAGGPVGHAGHRCHDRPCPVHAYHGRGIILELGDDLGLVHRPFAAATGMNILAAVIMLPITLASGQMFFPAFPFGTLEWSIIALSTITAVAYTLFITVINIAGPVFASQTGYLVTLGGVVWGMVLFGETHSPWVWASVVTMMMGLALVTPRKQDTDEAATEAA